MSGTMGVEGLAVGSWSVPEEDEDDTSTEDEDTE